MKITVNGHDRQAADGLNLAQLLEELGLPAQRVAVERNRQLVRRASFEQTPLAEGDMVEIVTLVGGG